MRRERELRQISLRAVSEATKINLRYLEALENNEFEHLPGGAFNRGYIRAVARHIGIDESEMIDAYAFEISQQSQEEDKSPEVDPLIDHFALSGEGDARRRRRAKIMVVLFGFLLLCLLAGGVAWGLSWWLGWGPYAVNASLESFVS